MIEVYLHTLGSRVRKIRKEREMTLTQLATLVGWDQPQMSRLENGKVNPTYSTLINIAAALKVPVEDLAKTEVPPMRLNR